MHDSWTRQKQLINQWWFASHTDSKINDHRQTLKNDFSETLQLLTINQFGPVLLVKGTMYIKKDKRLWMWQTLSND